MALGGWPARQEQPMTAMAIERGKTREFATATGAGRLSTWSRTGSRETVTRGDGAPSPAGRTSQPAQRDG